jgi:hypothetical protein
MICERCVELEAKLQTAKEDGRREMKREIIRWFRTDPRLTGDTLHPLCSRLADLLEYDQHTAQILQRRADRCHWCGMVWPCDQHGKTEDD